MILTGPLEGTVYERTYNAGKTIHVNIDWLSEPGIPKQILHDDPIMWIRMQHPTDKKHQI